MADDANRARARRNRLILRSTTVLGQILGYIGVALATWVLDYVAFRVGPIWVTGLACLLVRNGAYVPVLGLLADWCLGAPDTSFVFSFTVLIVLIAYPIVFPDLDIPATELWYSNSRTGAVIVPSFVISAIFLHYPRASAAVVKHALHRAWTDPRGLVEFVDLFWILFACVAAVHIIHVKLLPSMFVRILIELFWRSVGKRVYDLKTRGDQSTTPAGPFQHTELRNEWDIRLLQLLPRGNSPRVCCKLKTVDLDNKPPVYEAMSYTWGNPAKTHTIWIDGEPVMTTENVYNLLWERSPIFAPRNIWIDYLCINQDDNAEKASQVSLMRYIYQCASKVTIWLGAGLDSALAIDLVLELSHHIKTDKLTDAELYDKYIPQRRSPRWLALGRILDHPYFSRIWMVQEVAVNRNLHVVYGRETILWDTLAPVVLRLVTAHDVSTLIEDTEAPDEKRMPLHANNCILLGSMRNTYQGKTASPPSASSLMNMLAQTWTFNATDGRDRVFALIGVANDADDPLVRPNYDIPVEQVYLNAAQYLYPQEGSLSNLLCCAGIGWLRNLSSLPSWVPDWTIVGRSVISAVPKTRTPYQTAAGLVNRGPIIRGTVMELDVFLIDTIEHLTREYERVGQDAAKNTSNTGLAITGSVLWMREVRELAASRVGDTYLSDVCSREEALWRTLICDAPAIGTGDGSTGMMWPAPEIYGLWYRDCVELMLQDEDPDANPPLDPETYARMMASSRWFTSAQFRCYSRRFGVSSAGFMALVPALAEAGDVLAVVPGAPVPYLLRPVGVDSVSGQRAFSLVGECYVHGIMKGEVAGIARLQTVQLV